MKRSLRWMMLNLQWWTLEDKERKEKIGYIASIFDYSYLWSRGNWQQQLASIYGDILNDRLGRSLTSDGNVFIEIMPIISIYTMWWTIHGREQLKNPTEILNLETAAMISNSAIIGSTAGIWDDSSRWLWKLFYILRLNYLPSCDFYRSSYDFYLPSYDFYLTYFDLHTIDILTTYLSTFLWFLSTYLRLNYLTYLSSIIDLYVEIVWK